MGTEVRFRTLVADIYSSVGLNLALMSLNGHGSIENVKIDVGVIHTNY